MPDAKASSRRQTRIKPKLAKHYDSSFYDSHGGNAVASARIYLKFLWQFFQSASVLATPFILGAPICRARLCTFRPFPSGVLG